jgi:Tol biopolymer transport system component
MKHRHIGWICVVAVTAAGAFALLSAGCGEDKKTPTGPGTPMPPEQVVAGPATHPTLSPDGEWLAYRIPGIGIERKSLQTGATWLVTDHGLEPDWSRLYDLILVRDYDSVQGQYLAALNALNGDLMMILFPDGSWDDGAVWSPLMNEIAAQGSSGIVTISFPGGTVSPVYCLTPDLQGCEGENPTWSPDGQWIAFEDGMEILKVPRAGDTAITVVGELNDVTTPAWSPDAKYIAFAMQDSSSSDVQIWVADARGTDYGIWRVTSPDTLNDYPYGCWDIEPRWSPDSRTIYFESNRAPNGGIWRIGFAPR